MTTRALHVIATAEDRDRVLRTIAATPIPFRVEVKGAKRTLPQNARMWAMLTDIARQYAWDGKQREPEVWKHLFLKALGKEYEAVPSLDGQGLVYIGGSSSDLSDEEMTDLIELMFAWGSDPEHPVEWSDPREIAMRQAYGERVR
jgi:hypothetical protein